MRLPLYQLDAFTSRRFAGNPAGVVVLEEDLPDGLLQTVAVVMERLRPGEVEAVFETASGLLTVHRAGSAYRMDLPARRVQPVAPPLRSRPPSARSRWRSTTTGATTWCSCPVPTTCGPSRRTSGPWRGWTAPAWS